MTQKNRVQVRIADNDYTLVGSESFEYMQTLAHTVDHQMKEMMRGNRHLTPAMAAVLSALNAHNERRRIEENGKTMTTEVVTQRTEIDRLQKEHRRMQDEMEAMRREVAILKMELARVESEAGRRYGPTGRKVNIG